MHPTLPIEENFLGIEEQYSSYDASDIAILQVPYEHTVSYGGGTGKAPEGILHASHYVEFWDEELKRSLCFERGIATLPALELGTLHNQAALDFIHNHASEHLANGKFLATLGGEHTISAAPVRAHLERYPMMSVLQFDAHSDLRMEYEGNPYSHASVMARVLELIPGNRITQVGIRAQCHEEYELIQRERIHTFFARGIRNGSYGQHWMDAVVNSLQDDVYITFDVDYFDPAIMGTTGTPEPGGFFWDETIELLLKVASTRKIVGFDIVELAPNQENIAPTYLTAKLVYKLLNIAFINR